MGTARRSVSRPGPHGVRAFVLPGRLRWQAHTADRGPAASPWMVGPRHAGRCCDGVGDIDTGEAVAEELAATQGSYEEAGEG